MVETVSLSVSVSISVSTSDVTCDSISESVSAIRVCAGTDSSTILSETVTWEVFLFERLATMTIMSQKAPTQRAMIEQVFLRPSFLVRSIIAQIIPKIKVHPMIERTSAVIPNFEFFPDLSFWGERYFSE